LRIIRFKKNEQMLLAAVNEGNEVYILPDEDFISFIREAKREGKTPNERLQAIVNASIPISEKLEQLSLGTPIDAPEVWAAGVTYQKSKEARNYEATAGKLDATTFYDKVYDAERPEIFFKSTAARTVGPGDDVYLRSDSKWQIPEPELGLVLNEDGSIIGYTIGNDMSCRDIEGENPLYLPQAKIWRNSCVIGPAIRLTESVEDPYNLQLICRIYRNNVKVVEETANTGQLKRKLTELASFLKRDNVIFPGTVLLTGTCVVPPNEFSLAPGDRIEIEITGIGTLTNHVKDAIKI
jgi:2-dehydro-3-deoxy-D-arabinonate dehydratase